MRTLTAMCLPSGEARQAVLVALGERLDRDQFVGGVSGRRRERGGEQGGEGGEADCGRMLAHVYGSI